VALVQRRLRLNTDGVFGPATQAAIKRLQRRDGLQSDGVVGPATWHALGIRGHHAPLRADRTGRDPATGPGAIPSEVRQAIAGADRIARLPYRYGGGHRSFHDSGYDCSGSVSYVLHAAGVLDQPLDSSQLMSWGSPGPGRWITVYSNPGHAFAVIHGRRFDTSGAQAGSRWQPTARSSAGYVVRHPAGL
jgi:hypothetical protein